jgi:hypothetical protein
MSRIRLSAALVLVACGAGAGVHSPALSPAQVSEDIATFKAAFENLHPSLHRYAPPEAVSAFFSEVARAVPSIITERDLYRTLAPFASIVRDGHTDLGLSEATLRPGESRILPLSVHIQGDRLWVVRSHHRELTPGSEILAIDGTPAAEVLRLVRAAEPRDGHSEGGPRFTLSAGFRFARQLAALTDPRASHLLRIVAPTSDEPISIEVASMTVAALRETEPTGERPTPPPVELNTVDGVPVLMVRAFSSGIGESIRGAVRTVIARGSPALVIDVRGNGGGWDTLGLQLFAHIAEGPFQYYEALHVNPPSSHPLLIGAEIPGFRGTRAPDGGYRMTSHPNLGTHQPDPVNYRGRVVVLMDGGSFSTTAEFLAAVRASRRATLVGEESGGAECGNTSGTSAMVTLPHSRLQLAVPLVRYVMAIPCDGRGRGVLPDIAVPVTIEDRLASRDVQLARALEAARQPAPRRETPARRALTRTDRLPDPAGPGAVR